MVFLVTASARSELAVVARPFFIAAPYEPTLCPVWHDFVTFCAWWESACDALEALLFKQAFGLLFGTQRLYALLASSLAAATFVPTYPTRLACWRRALRA